MYIYNSRHGVHNMPHKCYSNTTALTVAAAFQFMAMRPKTPIVHTNRYNIARNARSHETKSAATNNLLDAENDKDPKQETAQNAAISENRNVLSLDGNRHIEESTQNANLPSMPEEMPIPFEHIANAANDKVLSPEDRAQNVAISENRKVLPMDGSRHIEESTQSANLPPLPEEMPLPEPCEHTADFAISGNGENNVVDTANIESCNQANNSGLLHFRKWWERVEVDVSVYGNLITGIPIFIEENTLRLVNDNHSYFIPLEKVDYIRTTDGLSSCFQLMDEEADHT